MKFFFLASFLAFKSRRLFQFQLSVYGIQDNYLPSVNIANLQRYVELIYRKYFFTAKFFYFLLPWTCVKSYWIWCLYSCTLGKIRDNILVQSDKILRDWKIFDMSTSCKSDEPVCLILAILEQSMQTLSHFLIYLCCTPVSPIPDLCLAGLCCSHGYRTKSWTILILLLLLVKGSRSAPSLSPGLALCHWAVDISVSMYVQPHGCLSGQWLENGLCLLPRDIRFKNRYHSHGLSQKRRQGGLTINRLESIWQLVQKCIQYLLFLHSCLLSFFSLLDFLK